MFKVIEDQSKRTVAKGENGAGLSEEDAQADVKRRNVEAEKLGIKTRYAVAELADESEALAA